MVVSPSPESYTRTVADWMQCFFFGVLLARALHPAAVSRRTATLSKST